MVVVLFQILSRILQQQSPDGSWGPIGSREETSYAIIALTYIASLPFVGSIWPQIEKTIQRGREYLMSINALENRRLMKQDFIWAAKTSYSLENICHSYVLAALNTPLPHCVLGSRIEQLVSVPRVGVENFTKSFLNLSFFSGIDQWRIKTWLIEGYLFMPELERRHLGIFGLKCVELEKYFQYLPFSWIASNGVDGITMGAQSLLDMMTISMLIFYVDEFFEKNLARGNVPRAIKQLPKSIDAMFTQLSVDAHKEVLDGAERCDEDHKVIYQQLERFVHYVLSLPKVQNTSQNDKAQLEFELKTYLLANTQQLEDNFRLRNQQRKRVITSPPSSYIKWVHNTGTEHFGGYCVFALMVCLLGNGEDFLPNSKIKYIAQDCARRASVALRMFNDSGSLSRDRRESNLNSVFFPEFVGENKSDKEVRAELDALAMYEKRHLAKSLEELESACGSRFQQIYKAVKVYQNVCEFFTDLYEMRKDLL